MGAPRGVAEANLASKRTSSDQGIRPTQKRISKSERLLNLVAFLLSSRAPVPFARIKGRVAGYDDAATPEALEKRFDRDKAELRGLGVPIEYLQLDEQGNEGYRIPRDQYFLPEIRLSVQEAAVLAVLQRYASEATGDPLARPLASALQKVQVDNPLTGAAAASVTEQHMLGVRGERRSAEISANLTTLADAVLERRPVAFRYWSLDRDEVKQREVEPYGLGASGRNWYLVGRDRTREAVRQFRVDRIRGRAKARKSTPFDVPEDFDIDTYVGRRAVLLQRDGKGERVVVELASEVAFMARDALREGWSFEELPDGRGRLSFEANNRAAAIRFVAEHAERARIVEPAGLADEARDYFQRMLERHQGEPSVAPRKRSRRRGGRK